MTIQSISPTSSVIETKLKVMKDDETYGTFEAIARPVVRTRYDSLD